MPYIESIRVIALEWDFQHVARVIVERHETIAHDDKFPHFEGKQYRSLGTMALIDGEDWKPNQRGVDVRPVEVGVIPIEPDGTSFIKMRFSGSLLGLGDWIQGEQVIARGGRKNKPGYVSRRKKRK